jgi:hypothetical protein
MKLSVNIDRHIGAESFPNASSASAFFAVEAASTKMFSASATPLRDRARASFK